MPRIAPRNENMRRVVVASTALFFLMTCGLACAATIVKTVPAEIGFNPGAVAPTALQFSGSQIVRVPRFDPVGGKVLEKIDLSVTGHLALWLRVENTGGLDLTLAPHATCSIVAAGPDELFVGSSLVTGPPELECPFPPAQLGASDGNNNAGADYKDFGPIWGPDRTYTGSITDYTLFNWSTNFDTADVPFFVALACTLSAEPPPAGSTPAAKFSDVTSNFTGVFTGTLTVTYTYSTVPAPTALPLSCIAAAFGLRRRR